MEESSLEKYFKNLRDEDKENLKTVLRALKDEDLKMVITGSSLSKKDYRDIDIVVFGGKLYAKSLDVAIGKLLISEPLKIISGREAQEECYAHCVVDKRYEILLDKTKIDISYSEKPFTSQGFPFGNDVLLRLDL